jgi:hypothetical protein
VTQKTQKESYSFVLGLNTHLYDNLFVYYGAGIGKYYRNIQVESKFLNDSHDNYYWAEDTKNNEDGIAIEFGAMYKLKNVLFSAGTSSIALARYDFQIGIGLFF